MSATTILNDVAFAINDACGRLPGRMYDDYSSIGVKKYKELKAAGHTFPQKESTVTIYDLDHVEVFQQTWGSTALGFGGMGGATMTSANVVIVSLHGKSSVYFGRRHAYTVDSGLVRDDVPIRQMPDTRQMRGRVNMAGK